MNQPNLPLFSRCDSLEVAENPCLLLLVVRMFLQIISVADAATLAP